MSPGSCREDVEGTPGGEQGQRAPFEKRHRVAGLLVLSFVVFHGISFIVQWTFVGYTTFTVALQVMFEFIRLFPTVGIMLDAIIYIKEIDDIKKVFDNKILGRCCKGKQSSRDSSVNSQTLEIGPSSS